MLCAPLLVLAVAATLDVAATAAGAEDHATRPGEIEGRPAAGSISPLQERVDAAAPGDTIEVGPGDYHGDLLIDRSVRIVGRGRPRLIGSGEGSVVRIRAAGVTLEGFDIDGRGGGDLGRDSSGVHVAAPGATIRDCRIGGSLFGVYLRAADGATVERCSIRGIPDRPPGEKGSGIHVWNTKGFRLAGNEIAGTRDGLYVQSSPGGHITGNVAHDLRYGLHFMYSDDNVFENNTFSRGDAGTAIMYSRRIAFRRNRFLRNRGFASVGLLFKTCEDVVAEDNLIADNARGIFLEGSERGVFRGNVIAQSDMAIVLYDSCARNRFSGNAFVGNLTPLMLVGRRTDTVFEGNYFSDNDEPDLDGDGIADGPYRLSSIFDHFRGNLTAADLFSQGPAALAIAAAERSFPVLRAIPVEDRSALVRPPALPEVPAVEEAGGSANLRGLAGSAILLGGGALLLLREARRGRPAARPPS